jgi:phasin family protein
MFCIRNRITTAGTSNLESQLSMAISLANKTLESVHRLTDLNMNLARATLEHSNLVARQLMSAEDREELLSVMSAQTQPSARRTFDYAYYLTTIFTGAQMDFIHILGEGMADTNRKVVSLVKDVGKDFYVNRNIDIEVPNEGWPADAVDVVMNQRAAARHRRGPATFQ